MLQLKYEMSSITLINIPIMWIENKMSSITLINIPIMWIEKVIIDFQTLSTFSNFIDFEVHLFFQQKYKNGFIGLSIRLD